MQEGRHRVGDPKCAPHELLLLGLKVGFALELPLDICRRCCIPFLELDNQAGRNE